MNNSVSQCNKHHSLRFNCLKILVKFYRASFDPKSYKIHPLWKEKALLHLSSTTERTSQQQSNVWADFQITRMARSLLFAEKMSSEYQSPFLSRPTRAQSLQVSQ